MYDLTCVQCFFFANLPPPKDLVTFNSAINACSKASQWQQALVLLSQLERRTGEEGNINMEEHTECCGKKYGNITYAKLMLQDRRNDLQTHTLLLWHPPYVFLLRKLQTNHISYNTSMDACARDSHWPEALYLLRPSGAVQMEGGQTCAAFQLTFGCFVNLCKVRTVKLWWCPPASKSAPKWIHTIFGASPHSCGHYEWEQGSHKSDSAYFFFLLRFFFCRIGTVTVLLMLFPGSPWALWSLDQRSFLH